ncbi:hypothetical protein GWK47_027978 [Chionoecetes opilio]|uniref:Uncharacterized protein n=1 Tax=Chionoecetes opilio TaxID=41210 RepID=A0A8J4YMC3_CHIOP|nr:hypothetical protein GWK47_027978 [Chionoecetes opilio]
MSDPCDSSSLLVGVRGDECRGWCITKSVTAMYGNYTSAGPASTQVYGTQLTGSTGCPAVASPGVESLMFTVPPPSQCPAQHDSCTACVSCTSCGRGAHYHHSPTPTLASVSPSCSSTQSEEDRTLALQLRAAAIFNKTEMVVSGGGFGGPATTLSLPPTSSSANFPYPPPSHLTPYTHPAQSCEPSPGQYCTCNASPNSTCSSSSSPLPSCPYHSFALAATTTTTTSAAVGTPFYPSTIMTSLSNTDFTAKTTSSSNSTTTTAYLDAASPSGQFCPGPSRLWSHPSLPPLSSLLS